MHSVHTDTCAHRCIYKVFWMILYICVCVYVCVYIVCIYFVMIRTFKSHYFLSFHLKDVFLYEVCMFCFCCCLCVFFGRLKIDIACSHTVYILIRDSRQVNGTNQSYAHLFVCVLTSLWIWTVGILFALLMFNMFRHC